MCLAVEHDRPILLSIGYSACHWCHVMERECFEDADIAALMNANFVCIKVDREERPDLDQLYMKALQGMAGGGGWPLTMFLTSDAKPFYGGTYFPPEDRGGAAGFPRVLLGVSKTWKERREEVERMSLIVADLLFCNATEAITVAKAASAPDAFARLKHIVPNCAVTDGPNGAFVRFGGEEHHVAAFPCEPKDLTGAGDMFAGAFLYGITHGVPPAKAAKAANFLSMKVITQIGARLHRGAKQFWDEMVG